MPHLKDQLLKIASLQNGQVTGRYAPSPSGAQHMGNIQTAVIAWLQARLANGAFVLRMDDIDTPRVKAGSAEQILDDLRWLGLDWDEVESKTYRANQNNVYYESQQTKHYLNAIERLGQQSRLFACRCSRKDVIKAVGTPSSVGHFVYPGTCRENISSYQKERREVAWRYLTTNEITDFDDQIMGKYAQNVQNETGDCVVQRRDGIFAYQLVTVVDDIQLGITDVVRGADLLASTPVQIDLFKLLGATPPRFWHLPLKIDENGEKLSKRNGSNSMQTLRDKGVSAKDMIGQIGYELGLVDQTKSMSISQLLQSLQRDLDSAARQA